ncbi:MAG: N-acetyl-gamma-glutamyl-phosphate reductase [Pseudomonadota bacterium]
MAKINVAIVGATGYAGAELIRILTGHNHVDVTLLTSSQHAGKKISEVYPAFSKVSDLTCRVFDPDDVAKTAELVFTALPHKISMGVVPKLLDKGLKVIDLSADFRFKDVAVYEKWYQPHDAASLLLDAVYGLPEINKDLIQKSLLVGNPGCYPTSIILPLVPFIKEQIIDLDTIIADSKSGVSGAGRSPSLAVHFCEVHEGIRAYKVAAHRHTPEIEEVLSALAGRPITITFTPHLVPMSRGMLSTIYARLLNNLSIDRAHEILLSCYSNKPFVRILPLGLVPDTRHVRTTNYCDIGVQVDQRTNRLIIISAIDNLVKGASGQAVQNMNLMAGLPETEGLTFSPFPV